VQVDGDWNKEQEGPASDQVLIAALYREAAAHGYLRNFEAIHTYRDAKTDGELEDNGDGDRCS